MVQRQTQQPGRSGNKQSHLNAAQVEKYIAGIDFPCDKEGLIDCANVWYWPRPKTIPIGN